MTVANLVKQIERYPIGIEFTIQYNQMSKEQQKEIKEVLKIAQLNNLIESISIGAGWDEDGTFNSFQNETFRRI